MEYTRSSERYAQLILTAMGKSKCTWIRKTQVTPEPTDFENMVWMRLWPQSDTLEECMLMLYVYAHGEVQLKLERPAKIGGVGDELMLLRMLNLHNQDNPYTPTSWKPRWGVISMTFETRMDARNMCSAGKVVTLIDFVISEMHFRLKRWKNEMPQAFVKVKPDGRRGRPNLLAVKDENVFEKYAHLFYVTSEERERMLDGWPEEKGEEIAEADRQMPEWDESLGDENALLYKIEIEQQVPTVSEAIGAGVARERRRIRAARGQI